ncbi:MAG TPA: hypothetical protein VL832_13870 [Puia sp.]|nr:hypothetical protein [Puia sp.]
MKKLALCFLVAAGALTHAASAQVKVNLDINIGTQPVWGPTGYDHAEYYYLPQYDVYYDVPRRRYIYWEGGRQVFAPSLPPRYHADLYRTYKVVLNEPRPYLHHDEHFRRYAGYREHHDQVVIRDSHEPKYWENKDHPEHNKWKGHGHDDHDHDHRH